MRFVGPVKTYLSNAGKQAPAPRGRGPDKHGDKTSGETNSRSRRHLEDRRPNEKGGKLGSKAGKGEQKKKTGNSR